MRWGEVEDQFGRGEVRSTWVGQCMLVSLREVTELGGQTKLAGSWGWAQRAKVSWVTHVLGGVSLGHLSLGLVSTGQHLQERVGRSSGTLRTGVKRLK